jgi:hypothetical protein
MRIFLASILNFVLIHCWLCQNIKILQKNFLIGQVLEEVRFFRVVLRLRGIISGIIVSPPFMAQSKKLFYKTLIFEHI